MSKKTYLFSIKDENYAKHVIQFLGGTYKNGMYRVTVKEGSYEEDRVLWFADNNAKATLVTKKKKQLTFVMPTEDISKELANLHNGNFDGCLLTLPIKSDSEDNSKIIFEITQKGGTFIDKM